MDELWILIIIVIIALIIILLATAIGYALEYHSNYFIYTVDRDKTIKDIKWETIPTYDETIDLSKVDYEGEIPKIIHQTFSKKKLPSTLADRINMWKKMNPDYIHCYYTDKHCEKFIKDHFPNDIYHAYKSLLLKAGRADLFRYCVLYKYGGVYLDIPFTPLVPLKSIISHNTDMCIPLDITSAVNLFVPFLVNNRLYNAFMYTKPNNPIFKTAIELTVQNINNRRITDTLVLSGPNLFADALEKYTTIKRKYWSRYFNITTTNNIRIHFMTCDTHYIHNNYKRIILKKYYPYHRDRQLLAGHHYTKLDKSLNMYSHKIESNIKSNSPTIIQGFTDNYLPINLYKNCSSCSINDCSYIFYDKHFQKSEILKSTKINRLQDAYRKLSSLYHRNKLWFMYSLYIRGGLHVDINYQFQNSIISLLNTYNNIIVIDKSNNNICSDFIYCKNSNSPFIKLYIETIISNILDKRCTNENQIMSDNIFTEIFNNHNHDNIKILYLIDNNIYDDDLIIATKHNMLNDIITINGVNHTLLWNNNLYFKNK